MKMKEETFQAVWQAIGGESLQQPLWLKNSLQHYEWGTTDVYLCHAALPILEQQPQAEVWVGGTSQGTFRSYFP